MLQYMYVCNVRGNNEYDNRQLLSRDRQKGGQDNNDYIT